MQIYVIPSEARNPPFAGSMGTEQGRFRASPALG